MAQEKGEGEKGGKRGRFPFSVIQNGAEFGFFPKKNEASPYSFFTVKIIADLML